MMYTLGTVCKLKGIDLDILIIGYNGKSPTNGYVYEYVGCLLDEGYIDSDRLYRFNKEHIGTLLYEGYNRNQTIKNNIEQVSVSVQDSSQEQDVTKEEYIFDENGVLVEIRRPKVAQETVENKIQTGNAPVILENIDIDNL